MTFSCRRSVFSRLGLDTQAENDPSFLTKGQQPTPRTSSTNLLPTPRWARAKMAEEETPKLLEALWLVPIKDWNQNPQPAEPAVMKELKAPIGGPLEGALSSSPKPKTPQSSRRQTGVGSMPMQPVRVRSSKARALDKCRLASMRRLSPPPLPLKNPPINGFSLK